MTSASMAKIRTQAARHPTHSYPPDSSQLGYGFCVDVATPVEPQDITVTSPTASRSALAVNKTFENGAPMFFCPVRLTSSAQLLPVR